MHVLTPDSGVIKGRDITVYPPPSIRYPQFLCGVLELTPSDVILDPSFGSRFRIHALFKFWSEWIIVHPTTPPPVPLFSRIQEIIFPLDYWSPGGNERALLLYLGCHLTANGVLRIRFTLEADIDGYENAIIP